MGAVRSGSFLLTILLVLYPLGAFSEIIKPTTAMFSDAHADVNADISGTLEKEWKHEFSMATPSPDALTSGCCRGDSHGCASQPECGHRAKSAKS